MDVVIGFMLEIYIWIYRGFNVIVFTFKTVTEGELISRSDWNVFKGRPGYLHDIEGMKLSYEL